jgi:hypothetical protein
MITRTDALKSNLIERTGVAAWPRIAGEVLSLLYIALIATIASVTGAFYVMFPELGALSHDVYTRPKGTWARNPLMIAITPVLTGIVGSCFTHWLPYGYLSVLLTVGVSIAIIEVLKSPVAPAISAGLLPVVVNIRSWWYGPGILLGCALLAVLSIPWKSFIRARTEPVAPAEITEDHLADELEEVPHNYGWLVPLIGFVAVATFCVKLTGLRFILFPPLVVIGFEMFGHTALCPWAQRPLWLPLACFLTAAGGLFFWQMFGVGPLAAGCGMAWGILVLRLLDLHVPPALAVALLPLVMDHPTIAYPFSVGIGTLMMTLWFLFYQSRFTKAGRITRA